MGTGNQKVPCLAANGRRLHGGGGGGWRKKMSGYFPGEGRGLRMVVKEEMQQDGGACMRKAVEDEVETMWEENGETSKCGVWG